jgi:hypothetical protein
MATARRLVAVSALAGALLAGTACGSDDGSADAATDGVASLREESADEPDASAAEEGSASDTTGGELEAPEDPEEAFALYDACLQEHGVDPGDGFVVAAGDASIAVAPDRGAPGGSVPEGDQVVVNAVGPDGAEPPEITPELIEASEACQGHLANATPDFDLTPAQEAAMEDAQLEFQQCMEDHGIEGGGFSISFGEGPAIGVEEAPQELTTMPPVEIDPEEFQAAAEECRSVYENYPELDDVFPDGGEAGGVFVGRADNAGDGS